MSVSANEAVALPESGKSVDVLIVGAGLSGLTAASTLANAASSLGEVLIVDGRDRVGGRLLSKDGLDFGAAWSWPSHDRNLQALAKRLNIQPFEQFSASHVVQHQGQIFRQDGGGDDRVRFDGGTQTLVQSLAKTLPPNFGVLLSTTVRTIDQQATDGAVVVHLKRGSDETSVSARRVIIAAPPRVYTSTIEFRPALGQKKAAAAERTVTWMEDTMKVALTYSKPWWRESGIGGGYSSHGPVSEWWDNTPGSGATGKPALAGFVMGEWCERFTSASDEEVRKAVLQQAVAMYGDRAVGDLVGFDTLNWRREHPFTHTQGKETGIRSRYGDPALREVEGRVHFAGTESEREMGHMEGAVVAGLRAGKEVAEYFSR